MNKRASVRKAGLPGLWLLVPLALVACGGGEDRGDAEILEPPPASMVPASPGVAGRRLAVPAAGQLYHGAFPGGHTGEEDDITGADVDAYETAVGRRVAWVYFSHNWYRSRAFPTATWIRSRGSVPFIRLMLRSSDRQNQAEPVFTLERIAAGAFDADLAAWGDAARDFGTALVAEWGTEMNGEWFSWNGTWNGGPGEGPRRFREAFRRIVTTVRGRGATNVSWVFHVNGNDVPDEGWNHFESYYPGAEVVDWVGLSNYGAQTPMDDEWPSFAEGMDAAVPRLTKMAPGKPVAVLEFGATKGNPRGDPAAWADAALRDLIASRWPSVRGFSWWNEAWENDGNPAHDTDMRVQTVPGLSAVFRSRLPAAGVLDRPLYE